LGYPAANEKDSDLTTLDLKTFFTWMEGSAERFEQDPQGEKDFVASKR
jgi:hypothetical protein